MKHVNFETAILPYKSELHLFHVPREAHKIGFTAFDRLVMVTTGLCRNSADDEFCRVWRRVAQ